MNRLVKILPLRKVLAVSLAPHPKYSPLLKKLQRLYPSAEVLGKVSRMMQTTQHEINDIESILRTDASLTSDIIRISNSAYYGYCVTSNNLGEALQRIGLAEAQKLVNLSLARSLYSKPLRHYQLSAYKFWASGLSCALLMEALGKRAKSPPSEAYTIGTLHAVGKILINRLIAEKPSKAIWNQSPPLVDFELSEVGVHYAKAGSDLLTRWNFPESISASIEQQLCPTPEAPLSAHALNFCIQLIAQTGPDLTEDPSGVPNIPIVTEACDLDEHTLGTMLEEAREHFRNACESLDMKP